MAKPGDMHKLNHCLDTLDSTDLGLSLVWLWTWSTIKNAMEDEQYKFTLTEEEIWERLVQYISTNDGFSLEYGAEQHYEHVIDWLQDESIMIDLMFEVEE
jgi:hypothetical protein